MKFCTNNVSTSTFTITSNNTTLTNIIPAGYKCLDVVVYNKEGFSVTVTLSTTVGGGELLYQEVIGIGSWIDSDIGRVLSFTSPSSLYFTCPETLTASGVIIVITSRFSLAS